MRHTQQVVCQRHIHVVLNLRASNQASNTFEAPGASVVNEGVVQVLRAEYCGLRATFAGPSPRRNPRHRCVRVCEEPASQSVGGECAVHCGGVACPL
jgi:hypothetical protein